MNKSSRTTMEDLNQEIHQKIERLAYQIAEARGLDQLGHDAEDWLQAEDEVLASLRQA